MTSPPPGTVPRRAGRHAAPESDPARVAAVAPVPPHYLATPVAAREPAPAAAYVAPVPPPDAPAVLPQFDDGVRPGDFVPYRLMPDHGPSGGRLAKRLLTLLLVAGAAGGATWWFHFRVPAEKPVATCARISAVAQTYDPTITLTDTAAMPTGYPLPPPDPTRTCSATYGRPAKRGAVVVWRGLDRTTYAALLTGSGWTPASDNGTCTAYVDFERTRVVGLCTQDDLLVGVYARR